MRRRPVVIAGALLALGSLAFVQQASSDPASAPPQSAVFANSGGQRIPIAVGSVIAT